MNSYLSSFDVKFITLDICNGLLLGKATLVRVLTCWKILLRQWALRKSWS